MHYERWAPFYEEIRSEFGFPFEREELAATRLEGLLAPSQRADPLGRVGRRLAGREAIVLGGAPDAGPPPVWRLPASGPTPAIVAADPAAAVCLAAGLVPDVVVTDLDGPVPAEIAANQRGSLVVVHAHGDNVPALERWVPEFPRELAGSWAGPPRPSLFNVGGFTDGDRAAFLAEELGATRVLLWGFDFLRVEGEGANEARKLRKLAWARRLLRELELSARCPILKWERDGRIVPYGSAERFTR